MSELQGWWNGLPPVTKWFFGLSVSTTLLTHFGVFEVNRLILALEPIYKEFQIWRLLSPFILHGLGIGFLMSMMFLLRFGQDLERVKFAGRSGDYLWMLLICAALLLVPGFLLKIPVLSNALIMSVIYNWARTNPETMASFMFGLTFKSKYLPWVMVVFTTLMGGNPLAEILGIVAGHIYFLLTDLVPRDYNINVIRTPNFIADMFDDRRPVPNQPGQYQAPPQDAGPRGPRYTWGTGQRLGN